MCGSLIRTFVFLSAVVFSVTKVEAQIPVPGCTQCLVTCGGGNGLPGGFQTLQATCTGQGSQPCAICIAASTGAAFSQATNIAGGANGCSGQIAVAANILGDCVGFGSVIIPTTSSSSTSINRKATDTATSEGSITGFNLEEIYTET
jgi:hypothetical protein